jgi:outer membrane protein OmpA-like peptidoglycan-associated protein
VEQQRNNYCYAVQQTRHPAMNSLPLDHVWDMGDGTRINGLTAKHCYANPGSYSVRSMLVDRRTGAIFHTLKSNELRITDHYQAWIAAPDTVRTGRMLALDGLYSHVPDLKPMDHRWDMGDGSLKKGSRIQHQYKVPGVYTVKLDIIGSPDDSGRIAHRCNYRTIVVIDRFRDHEDMSVVATYLDAFGRTHIFEYQELPFDSYAMTGTELDDATLAVVLFTSKERVSLEDARFTEVRKHYRIIERFDPLSGTYSYSVGETTNIEELYQIYRKVKELQFLDAEVFALRTEQLMDLSELDLATLDDLNHSKLRTSAIHFAYKSAVIEPGSESILDQIANTLRQYPELQLVIEAHTDDVGSRAYNMDLSQLRALSVLDHLFEAGIAPERMTPIGHGKNQPIASNRTEEGRAMNRRVEFRLVVKDAPAGSEPLISGAVRK